MSVNWKQIYAENPQLQKEEYWQVCMEEVPKKYQTATRRDCDICYEMRHGGIGWIVAQKYNVDKSYVTYKMQRVFSTDDNGEFLLGRGLVSHGYVEKCKRKKPLSTKKITRGDKSALTATFEALPDWKDELFQFAVAEDRRAPYAINLTPKRFASLARTGLKARGWPLDMWPFTNKSQGYQTFRRLLIEFRDTIAMQKSQLRKSLEGFDWIDPAKMPFDEVQIDWQTCDAFCRLTTECEGDVVDTRLNRCSLFVAFCVKSRCVLAWHLALTRNPSHHDVLQVIDNIYTQRKLTIRHTPELEHTPGSGYPSSVIPYMHMIGINSISMDNAWANLAKHVSDRACQNGILMRFAKGGTPLERNFVEAVFHHINGLTHSVASTTGSYPTDPTKEDPKNAKKAPELSLQSFRELLDVWISNYNADVKLHNMGESPLQRIERYYKDQPINFNHNLRHMERDLFIALYDAKIYSPKNEMRRPEIKLNGLVYRGSELTDRRLESKKVRVKRDKRDIRSVDVYTIEGVKIATLFAPRAYMHYPLTEETLERVQKFVSEHNYHGCEPVIAYLRYLFINKGNKKHGLDFLKVSEEIKREDFAKIPDQKRVEQVPVESERDGVDIDMPSIDELLEDYDFGVANVTR